MMGLHVDWVERFFESLFQNQSLHIHSRPLHYRNKITYNLPLTATSDLAEDRLNDVCLAIQQWSNEHSKPMFTECMVKATRRGSLLLQITVLNKGHIDMQPFRAYILARFPAIECLSYNEQEGTTKPLKTAPLHFLTDSTFVWESTPNGFDYRIGPGTFSEVNHDVELLQYEQARTWLEELHDSRSRVLVLSGRDVSSFGLGFGTLVHQDVPIFSHVVAVQHCPLVHQDAAENFSLYADELTVTLRHRPKADLGASFATELRRFPDAMVVGVMTGGRNGLNPSYLAYLCENQQVRCIVYNSCSTKSLLRDMKGFVAGGFCIDDFKSYDFLPGTGYTASLTKLVRRPRTLIIPVAPAGCGKSTLAETLAHHSNVSLWSRDFFFALMREKGTGVKKAGQLCHQNLLSFLRNEDEPNAVLFIDSTNGSAGARELYVKESKPELVLMVVLQPTTEQGIDFLLGRTKNRLGGNEDRHPSFPNTVEGQRDKHQSILKGMNYPSSKKSFPDVRTLLFRCDPGDSKAVSSLAYSVFLAYSTNRALCQTASPEHAPRVSMT